jgi:ribonuclease HI
MKKTQSQKIKTYIAFTDGCTADPPGGAVKGTKRGAWSGWAMQLYSADQDTLNLSKSVAAAQGPDFAWNKENDALFKHLTLEKTAFGWCCNSNNAIMEYAAAYELFHLIFTGSMEFAKLYVVSDSQNLVNTWIPKSRRGAISRIPVGKDTTPYYESDNFCAWLTGSNVFSVKVDANGGCVGNQQVDALAQHSTLFAKMNNPTASGIGEKFMIDTLQHPSRANKDSWNGFGQFEI